MNRREVIAGVGGAAAWPLVVRGQQPTMPVVGLLRLRSSRGLEVRRRPPAPAEADHLVRGPFPWNLDRDRLP
jgi:hypothetical protein